MGYWLINSSNKILVREVRERSTSICWKYVLLITPINHWPLWIYGYYALANCWQIQLFFIDISAIATNSKFLFFIFTIFSFYVTALFIMGCTMIRYLWNILADNIVLTFIAIRFLKMQVLLLICECKFFYIIFVFNISCFRFRWALFLVSQIMWCFFTFAIFLKVFKDFRSLPEQKQVLTLKLHKRFSKRIVSFD